MLCLYVCLCEGVRSPGTGITDSCELPCACWELNPCPLEEQPVLFQRTWVQFPARTWQLTTVCNSSSRASDTFTQTYIQTQHQCI